MTTAHKRSDPVTATKRFPYKLQSPFTGVKLPDAVPLDKLTNNSYRIESEQRRSLHSHVI